MLDSLTQRLTKVVKTIRGQARLTESNMQDMLREIRIALLEADVAIPVVKDLIARIKEKALGTEVQTSLTPGQALVGIVHDELTKVSADVYRPAAIDQLQTVSQQANIDFFPSTPNEKPLDIARKALEYAKLHYYDVLIVDTAGRLAIDEQMMNEVSDLEKFLNPIETFFVVDAMVGQDAVNTAKAFGEKLPLTGVILTKVDGDSRGGAALSVRMVTGKPIKFMGVGEKLNGFQRFDPQAMAGRILGMGDIVSLVDEVRKNVDIEKAQKFAEKMRKGDDFTLEDFKDQLAQVKNLGSFSSLIEKLPAQFAQAAGQVDDEQAKKQLARTEAIINSMTPHERRKPEIIKASRKRRIAAGAGTTVQEVNRLLKQFEQSREMMKMMKKGGMGKMMRAFRSLSGRFPGMGGMGGGF